MSRQLAKRFQTRSVSSGSLADRVSQVIARKDRARAFELTRIEHANDVDARHLIVRCESCGAVPRSLAATTRFYRPTASGYVCGLRACRKEVGLVGD